MPVTSQPHPLPRTAEALAAAELRAMIVRGELAPGAKVHQGEAARSLGVSVVPVREALKTLAGEGIVTYSPQRGYFVSELPAERRAELYEVRELVEGEAERLGVPALGTEQRETMRAQLRRQDRAVAERDAVEMIAANRVFHFAIFERCGNPWLVRFVAALWDGLDPYRVLAYRRMWLEPSEDELPAEILAEHEAILTALEGGEGEPALRLLGEHRRRSEAFIAALAPAGESH
jgi:DNA-binding GntR family transcriptional regulator